MHRALIFIMFFSVLMNKVYAQMPIVLKVGKGAIQDVAATSDGSFVVSFCGDRGVRVWDVNRQKEIHQFPSDGKTRCVDISPDGTHFIAGGDRANVVLRDVSTGKEVRQWSQIAVALSFSSDSKNICLVDSSGNVKIIRLSDGAITKNTKIPSPFVAAISHDGQRIASIGYGDVEQKVVRIWDIASGAEVVAMPGKAHQIKSIAWAPSDRQIMTGGSNGNAVIWDVATGTVDRTIALNHEVFSVQFSPDAKSALIGIGTTSIFKQRKSTGVIHLVEVSSGKSIFEYRTKTDAVFSVAFSENGELMIAGGQGGKIYLWKKHDTKDGR